MNKNDMFDSGEKLMLRFCERNQFEVPRLHKHTEGWAFSACAYYRPTRGIVIHVPSCAHIGTAGQSWSYPGYFIDRTPHGVIQHELGHHADWLKGEDKKSFSSEFSIQMRKDSKEEKLTNYCPNDAEWFAEMFRLFVTNSDLLKSIRPATYRLMCKHFDPVVCEPWERVLAKAPPRNLEQCVRRGAVRTADQEDWL